MAERSYSNSAVEYTKLSSIAGGGHAATPELAQTELPKPPGAELHLLTQTSPGICACSHAAPGVESQEPTVQ